MTERIKTIVAFDTEGTGQHPLKNPIIQIGAVVMSIYKGKKKEYSIRVEDAFCVCLEMNTTKDREKKIEELIRKTSEKIMLIDKNRKGAKKEVQKRLRKFTTKLEKQISIENKIEEISPGCLRWWKEDTKREEMLKTIQDCAIAKKSGYVKLHLFLTKNWKKFEDMKIISDNGPYDVARIDLEMQIFGHRNGFMYFGSKFGMRNKGYKGFGMDSNDFAKGVCYERDKKKYSKPNKLYKEIGVEEELKITVDQLKKFKLLNDYEMEVHSAIYDAAKIGTEYLTLIKHSLTNEKE